jgi:hypothetical protein
MFCYMYRAALKCPVEPLKGERKADSEQKSVLNHTCLSTTFNFYPHLVKRTTFITTITPLTRADTLLLSSNRRHFMALASFEKAVVVSCGSRRHTGKTGRLFGFSDPVNNEHWDPKSQRNITSIGTEQCSSLTATEPLRSILMPFVNT